MQSIKKNNIQKGVKAQPTSQIQTTFPLVYLRKLSGYKLRKTPPISNKKNVNNIQKSVKLSEKMSTLPYSYKT